MTIINPAIEGNTYCIAGSIATWYLEGSDNIVFSAELLASGTFFTKKNLGGIPYKIFWDIGEHLIRNSNSFSYDILNSGANCESLRVWYSFVDARGRGRTNSIDIRGKFLGFSAIQNPTNPAFYFPLVNCRALFSNPCENQEFRQFPLTTRSNPVVYLRTETSNGSPPNTYTLKIIDDGVEYFYDINDTNSVEVVNKDGQTKYTFNAGNQTIERLVDSEQNVALKCGLDCPPNTCFKCMQVLVFRI